MQLFDAFLEIFHTDLCLLEGAAFDAVRQGQFGGQGDVPVADLGAALEGGVGARRFQDHQVGTVPVDVQRRAQCSDGKQFARAIFNLPNQGSAPVDLSLNACSCGSHSWQKASASLSNPKLRSIIGARFPAPRVSPEFQPKAQTGQAIVGANHHPRGSLFPPE